MAAKYTYADVEKFIKDNGLYFSDADLRLAQSNPDAGMTIANYKYDYMNASTDDQRALANAGAESIRKDYGGYTGGADGSKYYLENPSPQTYSYTQPGVSSGDTEGSQSSATQYSDFVNPYADQQKAAVDAVLNREAFSYDPAQDVAWQQAKKMYLREADRAQQDAIGQAASLTGGMASTAAVTAAQQAGDYYRGQMNDALGDYQQQAYQRYVDEEGFDFDTLSALNSLSQQARAEFDTDRNFGYNQWTDELAYQTDKEQTEYEREWAEAQDKYQKEQDAYEKEQAAKEDARYETEYGDAISFDLYNSLMADYEVTGSSSVLKRARAILEALEKQIS